MSQDELKIYPTHRSLTFAGPFDIDQYFSCIRDKYYILPVSIKSAPDATVMLQDFRRKNKKGFIFYLKKVAYSLTLKPSHPDQSTDKPDVFILHDEVLKDLDGIFGIKDISFDHNGDQIIKGTDNGDYDMGIFLNPPTILDMERVCYSGGLMPQKSTYFWPKPCTGLIMYRF